MPSIKARLQKLEEKRFQKNSEAKIRIVFGELDPDYKPEENEEVVVFRSVIPGQDFEPSEHYKDQNWDKATMS